ncbi:MAG: lipoate--protein ligase family protein [Anaerolineales bacterium]|nr:lipoate--protein ligase family protein [Anaerolineales bacterium]MCX7756326.1 lipoate--protein ligase family protein [Anaerolineales bacterium]MDW8279331.1 lipoate--protein ligase family protein [Anaerolineales bacterium]
MAETTPSNRLPSSDNVWRLLITPPAPGAWNMAVDEAILSTAGRGDSPPTLRLYAWKPACLSLGYAQPFADVDMERLMARGWDVVRRPTGGRAILHADELTYSVTAPLDHPLMQGTILESYRRLAAALVAGVRALGIPVEMAEQAPATGASKGPVCFEAPSAYEIVVYGKKLIGSAQARKQEGVLQHGSFPLTGDLTRITQVLSFPDEQARAAAAEKLLGRATTAQTVLGREIDWETAAQAIAESFRRELGICLERGELSAAELARAEDLLQKKYAHPDWTRRA